MGKLKFGVSSIILGKEQKTENLRYDSVEWGEATTIQDFFRAGGNPSPVTPTRCKFLYTAEKLFVLFENMEEKNYHILKEENTVTELTVKRKDQVEVALSGREFSRRDFAVFTAKRDGSNSAFVEKGMTYLSGDQAYLGEGKDQGEKTAISKEQYSVTVDILQDRWYALFAIPWMLFGGKPEKEEAFDLQVYRKKHQSSEILCPTPLDLNVNYSDRFEYDPETFLEVSFGEKGETKTENGIVFFMPSGICHWQRPGVLEKTSTEERKEIYQLQKSAEPTTRENLIDRIRIAQRWQDSLTLEGFDFFFNQEVANPWKPMDPWVEKRLVNERLRENRWEEAAAELDRYLTFLRTCSAWWYADHSFGNQDLEKWTSCSEIGQVLETKDHVTICVESKERTWELMIYPVVGGFRMISGKKGFFDGKPEAFSMEESEHAYIIRSKEHEMILQKETLEISIDRKAITNLKNISFIFEKESVSASRIQFSIHENSAIYGFGERFDSVNQYGKTVALWQRDACEGCLASIGNQAYKNIPLVHTSDGFSFFANTSYRMRMDVGDAVQDYLSVEALGDVFDFYIFKNVRSDHTIEAIFEKNTSDWAEKEIENAKKNGLVPTVLENKDLTLEITRLEFASACVKLYEKLTNEIATATKTDIFEDCNDTEVLKAFELGITNGVSETAFAPNSNITREQIATMLARTVALTGRDTAVYTKDIKFADESTVSSWAKNSVRYMAQEELIIGVGEGKFAPTGTATREQTLAISERTFEKFSK